ncbi:MULTISPECIES: hypothetical protein [Burkholderia]|uniref:hypothetical protein n=1 Tax=Burkholderia TaxID=32008 RepID=UPI000752899B|nr:MULTISPECIES: hypothetical protein [Burkholderia]AOJ69214.1 hypothetical protein WS78_10945 [Burkholderia savannae]KVG39853.1 hypothetical protein WS77_19495 [Burkholderia sp. MSMB0265]KVG85735.1 hypothetical protein WS81_31180 [Burkholderia sp. MSMB2040]KVG92249.1 hypothetical protein WS82_12470 [Burkholderia sp. MSMB2041]KVG95672.1 hypothetical protein WS83_03765 [Burkholderia sp. MSMB2042]
MQRINTPDGNFHAGDPSAGVKGTVVTQPFMQAVQEELAAVPESVGIKLDPNDNGQLLKGIQKIVGNAGANYQPVLGYTPVQQGTGALQGQNAVKIGWATDGSGLRVTVDTTDLGVVAFASQLAAYATQEWVEKSAVPRGGGVMIGTLAVPQVQLSQGHADNDGTKPMIYNDPSVRNVVFRTGPSNAYKYTVIDESGVLKLPARPNFAGSTPWDTGNFDPNSKLNTSGGTVGGRLALSKQGWQADFQLRNWREGQDVSTYFRARDGGGLEIINNAYNFVTWSVDDYGTMFMRGQQMLNTDGNLWCAYRGSWMSGILDDLYNRDNGKANAGATCQPYDFAEFGPLRQSTGTTTVDAPDTWFVKGIRTDNWNGDAAPRTLFLRCTRIRNT